MKEKDVMLRTARAEDLAEVVALLRAAGLPIEGVADGLSRFVVAESSNRIVGVAGLERYGTDGLLRSAAVRQEWRGRGLGGALTAEVLRRATAEGVSDVYLLTETAADFFPRHGFRPIPREEVSSAVRASLEFAALCPSSSIAMVRSTRVPG